MRSRHDALSLPRSTQELLRHWTNSALVAVVGATPLFAAAHVVLHAALNVSWLAWRAV